MNAHNEDSSKETVVGTFKQTREVLPNGDTKEIRVETTVKVKRHLPDPKERQLPDPKELT